MAYPTGPVYIAYTSDALEEKDVKGFIKADHGLQMGEVPDEGVIHTIFDALLNADKPLLVCGPDIRAAQAEQEILDLSERLGLPVATGIFDYGSFPPHHPNYVGPVENVSEEAYDVVFCVGYCQSSRGNAQDLRFQNTGTIMAVGHDPGLLGNTFPLDVAVWGNVRHTLRALNALCQDAHSRQPQVQRRASQLKEQGEWRVKQLQDEAGSLAGEKPIHPNYLAHVATQVLPEETIIVSENFRAADHYMPFGFSKGQWRLVRTFGGSLGYGVGASIGTQLGAPDRPVVCSLGDGAVMYGSSGMALSEALTACRVNG